MTVFFLIITAIIAYFLGNFNGAIIASRFIWKKDIRNFGSGNAGLTNFYRIFGLQGIAVVILTDVLKSVIAILIGGWLLGLRGEPLVGRLFAGFCLMLGHAFPALFMFKGGKSVLCGGVLVIMLDWRVGLICFAAFILIVALTRYVSLGSVVAAALLPFGTLIIGCTGLENTLALLCALLVIFKHTQNIIRLIGKTESKIVFGKPKPPGY